MRKVIAASPGGARPDEGADEHPPQSAPPPSPPTAADSAAYLADMAAQLAQLAYQAHFDRIAYLLTLAATEARATGAAVAGGRRGSRRRGRL